MGPTEAVRYSLTGLFATLVVQRERPRLASTRRVPTVGFLVDRLEGGYQNPILAAVSDAVRERGYNLMCFAGGVLRSPHRSAPQRNVIYELVGPANVDGLVLLTGTIGNEVPMEELVRFCKRYLPLPMVSVAVDLEGVPSVLVDNDTGMRQAVQHIIKAHGAKRIGFIRGPEVNEDAERRYHVYQQVLEENGLPFDPSLVVTGDFEREAGHEAVQVLFEDRQVAMDALVSASDDMAIGALEALRERGVRVPEDLRMVSFNDEEEARLCVPGLTTVRQPLYEQGRKAAEMLFAQLDGQDVGFTVTLKTELVVRGSCGCETHGPFRRVEGAPVTTVAIEAAVAAERSQAQRRFQAERWARTLGQMSEALIASFDLASLSDAVLEQFPRLRVPSCFLALYDGEGAPAEHSRLALAYDEEDVFRAQAEGQLYPSRMLVPPGTLPADRPFAYAVEPLFFEKEQMGFALFEMGPPEGAIYESLRDQVSAALKGARLLEQVVQKDRQRRRLVQYILGVTPDMHRVQPLPSLSETILEQVRHVLTTRTAAPGQVIKETEDEQEQERWHGFVALTDDDGDLSLYATTGRFTGHKRIDQSVEPGTDSLIQDTIRSGEICTSQDQIIIPLRVGELAQGVVYLEGVKRQSLELDLLRVLSNQAAVAIQNIRLFEMAALDPLTGVHARRFFDRWILRELRTAFRTGQPMTLLMLDMDGLKAINDTEGHLVGDQALALMGRALRRATRNNDIIARYGGDEFAVILPQTDTEGAEHVARRLRSQLRNTTLVGPHGALALRGSVGLAPLLPPDFPSLPDQRAIPSTYFQGVAQLLIRQADEALYQAKRGGRSRYCCAAPTRWQRVEPPPAGRRKSDPPAPPEPTKH